MNKIAVCLAAFLLSTPARADWAEVGASYKCSKNEFALFAHIASNEGSVGAPSGMKSLTTGNNTLNCRVGHSAIQGVVWLSGPGHNGQCGSGGRIQIEQLQVNGESVVESGEAMLLYCSRTPTVLSLSIAKHGSGLKSKVCRGTWNGGNTYEGVKCDTRVISHSRRK